MAFLILRAFQKMNLTLQSWSPCWNPCATSKPTTPTRKAQWSSSTNHCVQNWVQNLLQISACLFVYQGLGQETAEKQAPSALEYCAQFRLAVAEHKKVNKVPTFQALNQCINDYNSKITVKKWRIDTHKKKLVSNLLKTPPDFTEILALHYDQHRHAVSGVGCGVMVFRVQCADLVFRVQSACWLLHFETWCSHACQPARSKSSLKTKQFAMQKNQQHVFYERHGPSTKGFYNTMSWEKIFK